MLPSTRRENHEISWSSWNCLRLLTFEFTKSSSKVRRCCLRYWLNEELQLCFQRRDYASVVGAWALHAYILCSSLRLCFFLCLWWGGWVWCQAALSPGYLMQHFLEALFCSTKHAPYNHVQLFATIVAHFFSHHDINHCSSPECILLTRRRASQNGYWMWAAKGNQRIALELSVLVLQQIQVALEKHFEVHL